MLRSLLPLVSILALAACGGSSSDDASEPAPDIEQDQASPGTDVPSAYPETPEEEAETISEAPDVMAGTDAGGTGSAMSELAATTLASLGDGYENADLANGARQFRRCQSCHTLDEDGRHTVGPNLYGVMGRPAAQAEDFSYSSQLSESGLTWDPQTLDAWIENPRALVPGNRMSFVGLREADDRRDVIAYIAVETAVEEAEEAREHD